MSSGDVWLNLVTGVSAAGLGAVAARLTGMGAKEALRRIALLGGWKSARHQSRLGVRLSGADAEVFLRNYVKSAEAEDAGVRSARVEVESD